MFCPNARVAYIKSECIEDLLLRVMLILGLFSYWSAHEGFSHSQTGYRSLR